MRRLRKSRIFFYDARQLKGRQEPYDICIRDQHSRRNQSSFGDKNITVHNYDDYQHDNYHDYDNVDYNQFEHVDYSYYNLVDHDNYLLDNDDKHDYVLDEKYIDYDEHFQQFFLYVHYLPINLFDHIVYCSAVRHAREQSSVRRRVFVGSGRRDIQMV